MWHILPTAFMTLSVATAAFVVWVVLRVVNLGRRPGRRFWIALGALLAMYPLSFGAWLYVLSDGGRIREIGEGFAAWGFYAPLLVLSTVLPAWMLVPVQQYVDLWMQGRGAILDFVVIVVSPASIISLIVEVARSVRAKSEFSARSRRLWTIAIAGATVFTMFVTASLLFEWFE